MDGETDTVAWCISAAVATAQAKAATAEHVAKSQELENDIKALKVQLDELITAKEDDETALLHKFRDLLNEKKLKIREQQKVLSSASFNSAAQPAMSQPVEEPEEPAPTKTKRKPAQSRTSKRKAAKKPVESESEEETVEKMEVDQIKQEPDDDDELEMRHSTTASEQATASEDEEDDGDAPMADVSNEPASTTEPSAETKKQAYKPPPPPRALPFSTKKASKPSPAVKPENDDGETDSDDEL